MELSIHPAAGIEGVIRLPGDKSISHRYAMLGGLATGRSVLTNFSTGADCASTLECMKALGVEWRRQGARVEMRGAGRGGLAPPVEPLEAGNSGTTMRLLSGILASLPFHSEIRGDESLSGRPMQRVMTPLERMGAGFMARDGRYPPLRIQGGRLRPIRYQLPVASAQVKSAVLLAGLGCEGETVVTEPALTRDHTEIALRRMGVDLRARSGVISVRGPASLAARDMEIPSDLSSAVFFVVAALMLPGSSLVIEGVGLNPTRAGVLAVLRNMGAEIGTRDLRDRGGERVGTLVVRGEGRLAGGEISGREVAGVIDEVPMLSVLGAVSRDGLRIRDAGELRVKETDRIATVVSNLRRMGVAVTERKDGMDIAGGSALRAARLDSYGDHRIAMAFAVAALAADGESTLSGAEAASVSFPEFYDVLRTIVRR